MNSPGKIPLIPTPFAQRIRRTKMTLLPGLVFVASVMVIAILWQDRVTPSPLARAAGGAIADLNSRQDLLGLNVGRFQNLIARESIADMKLADPKLMD